MDTLPEMLPDLLVGFPPAHQADWRAAVERVLAGADIDALTRTIDGVSIPPLYTAADLDPSTIAAPRPLPSRPAGAWTISQRYDHPDIAVVNRQILADLERGADGIWLRLDRAARLGLRPDHPSYARHAGVDGIMLATAEDLERVLAGVHLEMVHLAFDAGAAAYTIANCFREIVERRGLPRESIHVAFDCDPLGTLAAEGRWPGSLAGRPGCLSGLRGQRGQADEIGPSAGELGDVVGLHNGNFPAARVLGVSTLPYHKAGANAVQELAFAQATAVTQLRALAEYGCDAAAASDHRRFIFGIGDDFFTEIAKLRAARQLWARVTGALGGNVKFARPMEIHAVTSPRTVARRDPWINLVRATAQAMAAAIGGADQITMLPFDAAIGPEDDVARRLALNTQAILQAESHLGRILDAAGGSYYVEKLTDELARCAWALFQDIERNGGMGRALVEGRIQAQVAESAAARRAELAASERPNVGATSDPPAAGASQARKTPDLDALRTATLTRFEDYVARHPNRTGFDWPRLVGWSNSEDSPWTEIDLLPAIRDDEPVEAALPVEDAIDG